MTISYSIWQGSSLLSVNNIASSSDDILKVLANLNKLGGAKFTANVMKVEVK